MLVGSNSGEYLLFRSPSSSNIQKDYSAFPMNLFQSNIAISTVFKKNPQIEGFNTVDG